MASDKKRRKGAKAAKKTTTKPGPFRHPDGDRRHRHNGATAAQAIRDKELLKRIGAVDLPEENE